MGWMDRGSNPCGGEIFSHPFRPALGPAQILVQWVLGFFLGGGGGGQSVQDMDHPPPSSAEVKGRVELYLYSPSGPLWPVLGWTLRLPLYKPDLLNFCKNVIMNVSPYVLDDIVPKVHVKWLWFRFIQVFISRLNCANSDCGVVIMLYRSLLTSAKNIERVFFTGRS